MKLSDIMNVEGAKVELATPKPPKTAEQDSEMAKRRRETIFLSMWESRASAEDKVVVPTIHHFCAHPSLPQLPVHMQVLSMTTHAKPDILCTKQSQECFRIKVGSCFFWYDKIGIGIVKPVYSGHH